MLCLLYPILYLHNILYNILYYTVLTTIHYCIQYTILHCTQNVATTEVAEALSAVPGFSDVTVFGVPVPHCDGKVGMAAVVLADGVSERYFTQCCMMGFIDFMQYILWVLLSLWVYFLGFIKYNVLFKYVIFYYYSAFLYIYI